MTRRRLDREQHMTREGAQARRPHPQIVAEMLERRIKDPRLGFVTVTDTRITGDLREATVYYTVYGSDAERADRAAPGERQGRDPLGGGQATGVRHTPSLTFVPDALPENVRQIDDLLAKARAADEQVAKVAENARPAGDANPYRETLIEDDVDETDSEGGDDAGILPVVNSAPGRVPAIAADEWDRAVESIQRPTRSAWPATSARTVTRSGRCWPWRTRCARRGRPVHAPRSATPFEVPRDPALPARPGSAQPRRRSTRAEPEVMVTFDAASSDRLGLLAATPRGAAS